MAKKETLTRGGKQEACVNLDAPVGPTAVRRVQNQQGDVMLVQSIFHVLGTRLTPAYLKLQSMDEVPRPTGRFDEKTEKVIRNYQANNSASALRLDGVIDPASYRNRNLDNREDARFMTVTLFHIDLFVLFDGADYAAELTRLVPQLRPWLK